MLTFRALSLRRITTVLFVYQGEVSRHNKFLKIDFNFPLMIYHRKISTFIKKQNAMAYEASFKDSIWLKNAFENIISKSLLIVEAKLRKFRITKNITIFQIKLIRRLIYVSQFYKV